MTLGQGVAWALRLLLIAVAFLGPACRAPHRSAAVADAAPATAEGDASVEIVEARRRLMGTDFHISVASVPADRARPAIEAAFAEVARVERLLSPHLDDSDVSRINATAGGEATRISEETRRLLEQARDISELSGGAFDVTFAALSPAWRSVRERPPRLPEDQTILEALQLVGYQRVHIDSASNEVRLASPGMRIGLGGIGKGHGVDRAAAVLTERGIEDFIVGGGGDLLVRGSKRGVPWRLGIQHPRRRGALLGEVILSSPGALVSSGDYERFVEIAGARYHHILDPRNGRPARGCAGVTLRAPTATRADALATAVFVLGPEEGMRLVESLEGVEAVIIDEALRVAISPGLRDQVRLRGTR